MSDDLRDAFGEDIFTEPEEEDTFEEETGEAQNKTFLIAVAVLGGLLFLAIGVFILWALVLNPRMQAQQAAQNASIQATNTEVVKRNGESESEATVVGGDEVVSAEATPESTDTPEPTVTPSPTPVIKATNTPAITPTVEPGADAGEGGEGTAEATATPEPRRTATPTRTPRSTPTPKKVSDSSSDTGSSPGATPETGLGELLLVGVAALLLGLIIFARRLRKV